MNDDIKKIQAELVKIKALCENPHWTSDRKEKIIRAADSALNAVNSFNQNWESEWHAMKLPTTTGVDDFINSVTKNEERKPMTREQALYEICEIARRVVYLANEKVEHPPELHTWASAIQEEVESKVSGSDWSKDYISVDNYLTKYNMKTT